MAVLGFALLPFAGACDVAVVHGAALRRLPFAALADWLGCLAGLVARSCSRCLTGWNLGLAVAAAVLDVWPVASCGEAADATTRVASGAVCHLEKPVVAEDRLPCVCSGVVVVERCWLSRSALIPLAVLVLLRVVERRLSCVGAAVGFARCCLIVHRWAGPCSSLASCQVAACRCLDRWLFLGVRLLSCPWVPCCRAVLDVGRCCSAA